MKLLDGIISHFLPKQPTLNELKRRTKAIEQEADEAEARDSLNKRTEKAKKRIKATRKHYIKPIHILAGFVLLVIVILIIVGGC